MPKIINPATITTSNGQAPSIEHTQKLTGDATSMNPVVLVENTANAKHDIGLDAVKSLSGHVQDTHNAHMASAIGVNPSLGLPSGNVQGALEEFLGLLPPKGAGIGDAKFYMSASPSLPDWGTLRLSESHLAYRGTTFVQTNYNSYPYYWDPPVPGAHTLPSGKDWFVPSTMPGLSVEYTDASATNLAAQWSLGGNEPADTVFNVADGTYTGGGVGKCFTGAFSRAGNTIQTYRVLKEASPAPVVVTGIVNPADRGVVAILHWPAGGLVADFLAQGITDRVIASLNLGQGITGEGPCPMDGKPGGLFQRGLDVLGNFDPYMWPGQATGQASLDEIYSGLSRTAGAATTVDTGGTHIFKDTSPYWNYDARNGALLTIGAAGIVSPTLTEVVVAPGHGLAGPYPTMKYNKQVAFTVSGNATIPDGTYTVQNVIDANAIVLWTGTTGPAVAGGTIQQTTGCLAINYPASEVPFPGQVRLGTVTGAGVIPVLGGIPILGAPYRNGLIRGTTDTTADANFFDYRLPYLNDYSSGATGIKYTPIEERPRYLTKPLVADVPNGALTQAGNYVNFGVDYYPYQIARFRHRFSITPQDAGSYLLMHFATEGSFEALVRDGIWPENQYLYSVNVVNPLEITAGAAGLDDTQASLAKNLIALDNTVAAKPFYALRSSVFLDTEPTAPTINTKEFVLTTPGAKDTVVVSGISYFVPVDHAGHSNITIQPAANVSDVFGVAGTGRSYLTGMKDGLSSPSRILEKSPLLISLGDFATINHTLVSAPNDTWRHFQRLEFDLEAVSVGNGIGGTGPAAGDFATIAGLDIAFSGDGLNVIPIFSENARPHLFVRTPPGHDSLSLVNSADAQMVMTTGSRLLFHSTSWPLGIGNDPQYGNFRTAGGAPQHAIPSVISATKDTQELFLDEVYRYNSTWIGLGNPAVQAILSGPGLPALPAPIEVPVQVGIANAFGGNNWAGVAWLQNDNHTLDLSGLPEIQVGGIAHRNPPIVEGVTQPKPQTGILKYPKADYTLSYRPSLADDAITQFNYSASVGTRSYLRAFDCAFSRSGVPVSAENQPFVLLRLNGLTLADFAYAGGIAPGSADIAILAKVPGMTTWMDCGRVDGAGPSKQDPVVDGAGCLVLDADTFDAIDSSLDYRHCQIKLNVGPLVNLFKSAVDPQALHEVPILIQVVLYDTGGAGSKRYDFTWDFVAAGLNANARTRDVRGLIGIEVVRPI